MAKDKNPAPVQGVHQKKKTGVLTFLLSGILLIVLVTSFILAPAIAPVQSVSSGIIFGRYGSQEIAYRQGNLFARELEQGMQEASSQGYDTNSPFIYYTLWLRAFRTASQYAVLLDHSQRSGIDISEDELTAAVKESGYFSRGGVFSPTEFNNVSTDRKQSIINDIRESLLIYSYQEALTQNIIRSDAAINVLTHPSNQQRSFRAAVFRFQDYPKEKIREFAQENAQLFQQISVKRILIRGNKQDAVRIYSKLVNKEADFNSIFLENSREDFANEDITAQEGDLGRRFFFQIADSLKTPADAEKIFAAQEQSYCEPVRYKTQDEKTEVYAVYLITQAKTDLNFNDGTQRQSVLDYLISQRKTLISDYFVQQAKLIDPARFTASVPASGKTLQTDYLRMVYRLNPETLTNQEAMYYPYNSDIRAFLDSFGSDNQDIASAALSSREFFYRAFGLKEGTVSEPVILDNAVIVLQLINQETVEELPGTTSTLDFLLSYYLGQYTITSMIDEALKSRRYKDNFTKVYTKKIEPFVQKAQESQQESSGSEASQFSPAEEPAPQAPSANES